MAEVADGAAVLVDPRDPDAIAAGIREAIAAPRGARGARARARTPLHVACQRRGDAGRLPRGSRDAVSSSSTPTCSGASAPATRPTSRTCSARLPDAAGDALRFAAVTRHPDLVPDGVEPISLTARRQELRMAWSLPRLLRRLRPALAHFQYALPLACPCPAVVTVHDLSFERDPERDGTARPRRVPHGRPALRAARGSRLRRLRTDAARSDRALRHAAGARSSLRPTPSIRSSRPEAGATATSSSSARSSERKNPLAAADAAAEVGLPLVVAGPGEGAGARSRARAARRASSAAMSTSRSSRSSTAAPRASCCRRGTRASGCPCSRRWRAERPSSRPTSLRCARSAATLPCTRARTGSPPRCGGRSPSATRAREPASRARASSPGRRRARRAVAAYLEVLAP